MQIYTELLMYFFLHRNLLESNRYRIVVYRNGYATEPLEIVADLDNVEEVNATPFMNFLS